MNKEIHKKLDSLYEEFNNIFTKLVKLEMYLKDSKLSCYEWAILREQRKYIRGYASVLDQRIQELENMIYE